MAGLVVAGLTTWQYEGTTAKKKHEHRISYLTGGGLLMEGLEARPTLLFGGRGRHGFVLLKRRVHGGQQILRLAVVVASQYPGEESPESAGSQNIVHLAGDGFRIVVGNESGLGARFP